MLLPALGPFVQARLRQRTSHRAARLMALLLAFRGRALEGCFHPLHITSRPLMRPLIRTIISACMVASVGEPGSKPQNVSPEGTLFPPTIPSMHPKNSRKLADDCGSVSELNIVTHLTGLLAVALRVAERLFSNPLTRERV